MLKHNDGDYEALERIWRDAKEEVQAGEFASRKRPVPGEFRFEPMPHVVMPNQRPYLLYFQEPTDWLKVGDGKMVGLQITMVDNGLARFEATVSSSDTNDTWTVILHGHGKDGVEYFTSDAWTYNMPEKDHPYTWRVDFNWNGDLLRALGNGWLILEGWC